MYSDTRKGTIEMGKYRSGNRVVAPNRGSTSMDYDERGICTGFQVRQGGARRAQNRVRGQIQRRADRAQGNGHVTSHFMKILFYGIVVIVGFGLVYAWAAPILSQEQKQEQELDTPASPAPSAPPASPETEWTTSLVVSGYQEYFWVRSTGTEPKMVSFSSLAGNIATEDTPQQCTLSKLSKGDEGDYMLILCTDAAFFVVIADDRFGIEIAQ